MKWLLPIFLTIIMAGCATPPPLVPTGMEEPGVWARTGRFAVTVEELDGRQHAVQGGLSWRDAGPAGLTLDLNSPLGAALARLEVAPDGSALLTEADGTRTHAPSADDLLRRVLGSSIPVANLRRWLRGQLPDASQAQVMEADSQGRATRFVQDGWRVQVTAFDALGPLRMRLQRNEPGNRTIDVRLVLSAGAGS